MKHIFVVNPLAGAHDSSPVIERALASLPEPIDYHIHHTTSPGEATQYAATWCEQHREEPVRFYACGGDGTLNELASAVVHYPWAQLTAYPCGSGNDYVKYYGGQTLFLDIASLVKGETHQVDVMEISDVANGSKRYAINACNIGFEAAVANTMNHIKRNSIFKGKSAYTAGIVKALFSSFRNHCSIAIDGTERHCSPLLLATFANGQYVGGSYQCAPRSHNDDGLIEVCIFAPLSVMKLLRYIGVYEKGKHLEHPVLKQYITYARAHEIELQHTVPFLLCIDGEILRSTHFIIRQLPKAITFVAPHK